jgi:hypothetical protein
MGAKLSIVFSIKTMTVFQIRRVMRTNDRKARILAGCEVGQSVGPFGIANPKPAIPGAKRRMPRK